MLELWAALSVFALLCASAALGFWVKPLIPEAHRSADSADLVRLVNGMLVTFAAIVLGMLTTSVKTAFDTAERNRGEYAARLTQLDRCLRDYGADADPLRGLVREYTAAVVASTWPSEPLPAGAGRPDTAGMPLVGESEALGRILDRVHLGMHRLQPADTFHARLAADCTAQAEKVRELRWVLIEGAHGSISQPFFRMMVLWLMVVFASFGLHAPRNGMVLVAIALCAACLASAVFVILDMDVPYGGLFGVPSRSMRAALMHMLE